MNFLKTLFGGKSNKPEEPKKSQEKKDFDILKYDGVRALKSGQVAYAVKCFQHALQIKDDLQLHDCLSQAYIATDQLPQAYEQLQKLADAQPNNLDIFLRIAHVAYMMEDYLSMSSACEKAVLINNSHAETYYLYAKACKGQDDSANAIAMLTKAIKLKDDYLEAYLNRSEILLENNDVAEAEQDANVLMQQVPDNEDVLMLKARIEKAYQHNENAIVFYTKAIDQNPFRTDAFSERAEARKAVNDLKGAQEDEQKAKELSIQQQKGCNEQEVINKQKESYKNVDPFGIFGF